MKYTDEEGKEWVLGHSDVEGLRHDLVRSNHLKYTLSILLLILIVLMGVIIWSGVLTNIIQKVIC